MDVPVFCSSKNAIKKKRKAEKREENAVAWKKCQKERRKTKRLLAKSLPLVISADRKPIVYDGFSIISNVAIDLGFLTSMTSKELKSLCSQIMRCYSLNRRYLKRFKLILFDATDERLSILSSHLPDMDKWDIDISRLDFKNFVAEHQAVYLSADASATLESIRQDTVYIIGGLVDHNRFKRACFEKADSACVSSARLPISENVSMCGSKVLTIVNVYEILLQYLNCNSWKTALESAIPKRKISS